MASLEILEPRSLEEALQLLDPDDPAVRPLGGGTALMLMMKARLYKPRRLVSMRRIGGRLCGIRYDGERCSFRLGAMTTFSELERSPEIRTHLPVVARTMKTLSNVRVRNVATLGGSLAHADPHLDLPAVWLALGAKAVILAPAGERVIDVADIFAGYYETTLKNNELIAELIVQVRPGWQSTYVKVTTRASHDWPALGLAVCAEIVDRSVKDLRLVLSAAVDKPTRLLSAEAILRGGDIDRAALRRAGDAAVEEAAVASDSRGSALYKQHLLRVHLGRAIDGMIAEASR